MHLLFDPLPSSWKMVGGERGGEERRGEKCSFGQTTSDGQFMI